MGANGATARLAEQIRAKDAKLPALTGLRFFAAFAVLISHFSTRGLISIPAPVFAFVDGGRTAVSLFFVLSGFILTYNYETLEGKDARRRFYVNRIARIYPVVLLSLAVGAVGVLYAMSNPSLLRGWYSITVQPLLWLGVSFASQVSATTGWFPIARINQPWDGPAWSIACEFFFYALFPFVLAWMRKRSGRTLVVTLVLAFIAQGLLIIGIRMFAPHAFTGFLVSQFPITHLFEFIVGVAAGLFFLRGGAVWLSKGVRRSVFLWGSLAAIVFLSIVRPIDPMFYPLSPFFAILIVALALPSAWWSLLAWRPLLLLGEASFALYLVHTPLMNIFSIFPSIGTAWGWVYVIAAIGASVLIFTTFETPARIRVRRALTRKRRVPRTAVPASE